MARVLGALLVAPSLAPLLLMLVTRSRDEAVFFFANVIAYGSALLFGIPLFLLFRRLRWLKWWHMMLAGALCMLPFAADWVLDPPCCQSGAVRVREALLSIGVAATSGLCFWVLAFLGNSTLTAGCSRRPQAGAADPER